MDAQPLLAMTKSVAIIGGGFAGLSAGVYLAEKGFHVEVFEKRPLLGGRAYSVKDSKTGDTMDNGQHLMMGCYHHTLAFLEKIGTRHLLEFQEKMEVNFADPQGRHFSLSCPNLPAPLHLLGGLIGFKKLSWSDKWAMMKLMAGVKKLNEKEFASLDSLSCEQWLTLWNQSLESIQSFWEPLILATLNEIPSIASAQMLAVVLRDALLKSKQDSLMVWSKVGLSELYTEAAPQFIENLGGKVHRRRGVQKIVFHESASKIEKLNLEDGSEHRADYYINACPPEALLASLDEKAASQDYFKSFSEITFSPILGINLWFDRSISEKSFTGLIESPIHWMFNKAKVLSHCSKNYYSLVISGAYELKDMPHEDLLKLALVELHKAFPQAREAQVLHHRILKELKATPSFGIHSNRWRPSYQSPYSNFYLAGDWTATGLPATIEGAVKSGYEVSELLFAQV